MITKPEAPGTSGYKLYALPLPIFLVITSVVLGATYLGVLLAGMAGAWAPSCRKSATRRPSSAPT